MGQETSSGFSQFFNVKMNCDQDGIQGTLIVSGSHQNHCLYGLARKFFREILVVIVT